MRRLLVPDQLWELVQQVIPKREVSSRRERPRIDASKAINVYCKQA